MDILKYLDINDIKYELFEHNAVFTVEEAKQTSENIPGIHCKNLFLRNRKGDEHFLIVLEEDASVNLKELSKKINSTPLSFASKERLMKFLKVEPGSVSLFGLINDNNNEVKVIIDKKIINSDKSAFHPNKNTATISLLSKDLIKFINIQGYEFFVLENK